MNENGQEEKVGGLAYTCKKIILFNHTRSRTFSYWGLGIIKG